MIHFIYNMSMTDDTPPQKKKKNRKKKNKRCKVRPWIEELRDIFLVIPPEENHAIDEVMVSFKGED